MSAQDQTTEANVPIGTRPIVIFGTGGSGTRAVAQYVSECGIQMGYMLNASWDALAFNDVVSTYSDRVVGITRSLDYELESIEPELVAGIIAGFRRAAMLHLKESVASRRWGFKQPRNILMLPFIDAIFPDAVFVHVVRDGRDMLLSRNRNQPQRYFEPLFGKPFAHTETDIARYWAKSNLDAMAFGKRRLKDRYVVLRIEDACGQHREKPLTAFAQATGIGTAIAVSHGDLFEAQNSFGRGLRRIPASIVDENFRSALSAFQYI